MITFHEALEALPLIAILRGLQPAEAPAVGGVLVEVGFRLIEVPLNSPAPFESIARLSADYGEKAVVGAGTVLDPVALGPVAAAGGRLIVMPHCNLDVTEAARERGLACCPGVATPTEAFAALEAGADALKLFPAEGIPPAVVKALRAVLPEDLPLLPVGGITPQKMAPYVAAGASGFGLGSALFKPGRAIEEIAERAAAFVAAWKLLR